VLTLAAHADWSIRAEKRFCAIAMPDGQGWRIEAPTPVGPPEFFLARLRALAVDAPVALGIDCPIGLPRAYAALHATEVDFPAFLRALAGRPDFYRVAATLAEICPQSPFYPARGMAGMTRLSHAQALGLANGAALCRACDRATTTRPAGAPLFWTLGANQSGKAAIAAWRDMLGPALLGPNPPALWPFDGPFLSLLRPGGMAIAETYPAEAMRHLALNIAGSKRRQSDRAAYAQAILAAMGGLNARPTSALRAELETGFGPAANGEDRFDSLLGVLCVLGVLTAARPDTAPPDPWIRRWEGWVLGQVEGG
jgi:hypothetical protein